MTTVSVDLPSLLLMIDNQWRAGGGQEWREVINPATERPVGRLAVAAKSDLDEALASAAAGFEVWRKTPAHKRAQVLRQAAQLLAGRRDEVAAKITAEMGKPIGEARIEVTMCVETFAWCAEEGMRAYGRDIPARLSNVTQRVVREPIGVVAAFTPWNFPANQAAKKIAAALAAGCAIIIKGPEEAPSACIALAEVLVDAGLPAGALNLVFGHPPMISEYLIPSPVVRKMSFTGSVPVGKHLARLAAGYMKPCTMELGGHAPVVIFDDVTVDDVVPKIVAGKYRNAGQVCISPTRFYVQETIYKRTVEAFAGAAKALRIGNGTDAATQMGPLANSRRRDAVEAIVEDAVKDGAKVAAGGRRSGNHGYFYEPTALTDVPRTARIMNDEPFGPVALFMPFGRDDEIIAQANDSLFGLAAYGFTNVPARGDMLMHELQAGMVSINHFGLGLPETPFGGIKESGYGREGGSEALEAYFVTKFVSRAA
ncbi:NAD-dependent succinate-semialdehyde dehydrogenase [Pseudolabrys taiwanensis]|nr:NAD-dependent succinate-semialdehyde dehydrogenase [Pseudolabrys taiwanensis]